MRWANQCLYHLWRRPYCQYRFSAAAPKSGRSGKNLAGRVIFFPPKFDLFGRVYSTASFAKFSRIKRYQGKILAVTNVLVQVSAENLKCKFLYRYMGCPQTFAEIPTDQRELCERGCTSTSNAGMSGSVAEEIE